MGMPVKGMIPSSVMPSAQHFPDLHFSVVEAVAQAWARMDNVIRQYKIGAEENPFQIHGGLRYAYIHDAATLLRMLKRSGLEVIPQALPLPLLAPVVKPKRIRDRSRDKPRPPKVKLTPGKLKEPNLKNPVAVMHGWDLEHWQTDRQ